jgi:TPR repeat protein
MTRTLTGRLYTGLFFALLSAFFTRLALANDHVVDWAVPIEPARQLLLKKQYPEALKLFKQQATLGNGLAQFNVALFYDLGWGVSEDRKQACQWYQQAANSNMPGAMQQLGECYLNGTGLEQSTKLAFDWFIKAYQEGVIGAACQAGELLMMNNEIKQDLTKGLRLCIEAGQQGAINAQSKLGKWYFNGTYLKQDYQQAFNWLHQAAGAKSAESAHLLAQFYAQGIGMDPDHKQALYFYEMAAARKYSKAYLTTAALYWQQFTQAEQQQSELLAKSYLWAKAAFIALSDEDNQMLAQQLLLKIQTEMPPAWQKELDQKVQQHLAKLLD